MSSIVGKIDVSDFDGDGLDIIGTDGFDALFGTKLGDFIDAKDGNDVVAGNGGNDLIDGGAGNDTIVGGHGDDSIIGAGGDDLILGGFGDDIIEAGSGDDLIFGDFGDDCIHGADGNDTIYGGPGSDILTGGAGSDLLIGGSGADLFEFDADDFASGEIDTITDFQVTEDSIVIKGLSENDSVAFDPISGGISINGHSVINFKGISDSDSAGMTIEEDEDGDFEVI